MSICEQILIYSFVNTFLVDMWVMRVCKPSRWRYPTERKPMWSSLVAERAQEGKL